MSSYSQLYVPMDMPGAKKRGNWGGLYHVVKPYELNDGNEAGLRSRKWRRRLPRNDSAFRRLAQRLSRHDERRQTRSRRLTSFQLRLEWVQLAGVIARTLGAYDRASFGLKYKKAIPTRCFCLFWLVLHSYPHFIYYKT